MRPFAIGDVNPNGQFVHVFNETAFEVLISELDTIRDFTDYLQKRSRFLRSGRLFRAMGEENLFAHYAVHMGSDGHEFVTPPGTDLPLFIGQTKYEQLLTNPQYLAKKQADEISYLWDRLIESFTAHMLRGTSLTRKGHSFNLSESEIGVRYMALERRFVRRTLGASVAVAMQRGATSDCFRRFFIREVDAPESETAYFIQTLKFDAPAFEGCDYQEYRTVRAQFAETYALGILERHARLKRVIGISCEPPGSQRNSSEDLLYAEQQDWSEEDRKNIKANCALLKMLQPGSKLTPFEASEFPQVD